jgi:predicted nucleic acid-binding protein
VSSLEQTIPAETSILLDTTVVLAWIGGSEPESRLATAILDEMVRTQRNDGVVSTVTVGEVLVRPHRAGVAREVALGLLQHPGLIVRPVDFLVAAEAARLRAESTLKMPEALILATGVMSSTQWLVTNDRRLAATTPMLAPEMKVCLLSDFV